MVVWHNHFGKLVQEWRKAAQKFHVELDSISTDGCTGKKKDSQKHAHVGKTFNKSFDFC